jgi:cytochrome c-type biogenesis protein CcmH
LLLLPLVLGAAAPVYEFETEAQAARFKALTEELRCLVCQGQNIASSQADLAKDMRGQVQRQILDGKTDAEIKDFVVARYGEFALFRPPVKASTYLLWFGPFGLMIVGAAIAGMLIHRQRRPSAPLSAAERARVRALVGEEHR